MSIPDEKKLMQELANIDQQLAKQSITRPKKNHNKYAIAIPIVILFILLISVGVFKGAQLTGLSVINQTPANESLMTDLEVETVVPEIEPTIVETDNSTLNDSLDEPPEILPTEKINQTLRNISNKTIEEELIESEPKIADIGINLRSPMDGEDVMTSIDITYEVEARNEQLNCMLQTKYRYVDQEYELIDEQVPLPGINTFELRDIQPGEYVWRIGCVVNNTNQYSEERAFTAHENIIQANLTETNITETNQTQINQTALNETIYNETAILVMLNGTEPLEFDIIQGQAEVGREVEWTKRLDVERQGEYTILTTLPPGSKNITVYEVGNSLRGRQVVSASSSDEDGSTIKIRMRPSNYPREVIIYHNNSEENGLVLITGFASAESGGDGLFARFYTWIMSGITGASVTEIKSIQLQSPSHFAQTGQNLNLIYQTDRDFDQCLLYIDSNEFYRDTLVLSGTNFFEIKGIAAGEHTWQIACQNRGNSITSETRHFTVLSRGIEDPEELDFEKNDIDLIDSRSHVEINITDENLEPEKTYEIKYTTPGPTKKDISPNQYLKRFVVSSDINYTNVKASALIPYVPEKLVRFKWLNGIKNFTNYTLVDTDNDSLIDLIEWTVPHLSDQIFELNLSYEIRHINITDSEYQDDLNNHSKVDTTDILKYADNITVEPRNNSMMLKFYELLANNDTISVYAIAEDNSRIQVISEGVVVAETTMNKGEQAWRNITITGLNTSADYVYIHSDSSIKYDYVTAYKREAIIPKRLIPAQNMSIVLTHNESIDSAVGYSSETNNVTIKDDKGNSIAKLNVFFQNAEDDINLSIMSAATNHTSMKSVVHMDSWPSEIAVQKTLYIPSTGKGAVYICPNASTLDDVYEECAGGFHAAIGNTIVPGTNRMINVVDVLLNGTRYYEVSGLVGTGGGESIEILNVHSFPILGGNWTVMFNTTGIADLKITPLNGTTFSELLFDDVNTTDDLEFQSIMCGNESLAERMQIIGINGTRYNYSLLEVNDSIRADVMLIEDYGCNSTGYFTNKELYGGSHHLLFEFGGANATAENYVSQLFCEITTNCLYTDVMHLSSLFNAHAELNTQSNYDYTICCRENFGEALGTDCAANDAEEIISLESITNSQVEKVSESNYANDVCLSPTSYYNISCDYTTDCTGYDTCVASISSIESQSNTNLQIGNCTGSGSYATKICCATEEKESEPSMTGVVLNATDYPLNKTSANLTAWPGLVTDPEGDDAKIYYNWQVNNTPIAVLNLMMSQLADESYDNQTVYDISGYGNDGRLGDSGEGDTAEPVFNSTGGYDGFGAYEFDGTNDYIIVSRDPSLEPLNEITISSWINTESYPGWQRIVTKGIEAPTYEGYSLLFDDSNILFQLYAGGSIRQFSVPHTLSLNNWHQVIATYDGSNMRIYQDGALLNSLSVQGSITHDTNDDLFIGRYRTQQGFFNGTMGDFVLYTRSLSQNQIITLYNSGAGMLNLTVSDETVKHDNWTVSATPVDSQGLNGSTVTSGPVEIINTIPTVPTLIWPEDGNASLITRVPNLNWTDSYDADGDLLTYRVNLTHDTCGSPIIYNEVGDSNKTVEQELLTKDECPGWYNWTIEAYDGEEYSLTSNVFGFQILSILILSLNPDVVDFGNMDLGDSDNTIDDSPYPFVLENQGTVFAQIINVTANASLWSSEPSPTDHFQIRAGDHEVGSINLTGSATTWVNVSTLNLTIIDRLNYSDANDEARLDLSIIVPSAETSGEKSVLMTFYGVQP